jgi:nucleoside-diphosphate-sugar epimerase
MKDVVIITGCSGRIGFKAAERLSEKYQVVGFDICLQANIPGVEFFKVDVGSEESVKEGLDYVKTKYGNKIASIVHLAAYYNFTGGGWDQYQRITVNGTRRLLDGLDSFTCDQFIFSSTMLVHAPSSPGHKISEDSPVVPSWDYPKSKVLVEKMMHERCDQIPMVALRIAGVYDDKCHSIPLSNQIQRIYENQFEGHLFAGDLTHGASFVHMDDVIESIVLTVDKRKQLPKELTLLIGEDKTLSYDSLQRTFSRLIYGKEWRTISLPKPVAKVGAWVKQRIPFIPKTFILPWMIDLADDHYELDISRAKKMIGWAPKRNLEDTIPLWIAELKKEPLVWYENNKLKPSAWVVKQKA